MRTNPKRSSTRLKSQPTGTIVFLLHCLESNANNALFSFLFRYDLLCLEGIAQALRVFEGLEAPQNFHYLGGKATPKEKLIVKPEVQQVTFRRDLAVHTHKQTTVLRSL